MPSEQTFEIAVGDDRLPGIVTIPATPGPHPAVVICHGFKGFLEWGFFPFLAELLAERGFCAVRFNFSGSGMRPEDEVVTDPEAFRNATFSKDLRDVEAVIDAVGVTIAPGSADSSRIALLGHSRGGGIALLAAARRQSVRALVTWASVATFDRLTMEEKQAWRRSGEVTVVNARTGQELTIASGVLEDLEAHMATLDLEAAAAARRAPWLILHGEDDETVPSDEARRLAGAAGEPAELHLIAGGNHTLGARHPFAGPSPALIEAMNRSQAWLRHHAANVSPSTGSAG